MRGWGRSAYQEKAFLGVDVVMLLIDVIYMALTLKNLHDGDI
jgi:hypothetical protein